MLLVWSSQFLHQIRACSRITKKWPIFIDKHFVLSADFRLTLAYFQVRNSTFFPQGFIPPAALGILMGKTITIFIESLVWPGKINERTVLCIKLALWRLGTEDRLLTSAYLTLKVPTCKFTHTRSLASANMSLLSWWMPSNSQKSAVGKYMNAALVSMLNKDATLSSRKMVRSQKLSLTTTETNEVCIVWTVSPAPQARGEWRSFSC